MDKAGMQGQLYCRTGQVWSAVLDVGRSKEVGSMGKMRGGAVFHKSELAALFMTVIPHISCAESVVLYPICCFCPTRNFRNQLNYKEHFSEVL